LLIPPTDLPPPLPATSLPPPPVQGTPRVLPFPTPRPRCLVPRPLRRYARCPSDFRCCQEVEDRLAESLSSAKSSEINRSLPRPVSSLATASSSSTSSGPSFGCLIILAFSLARLWRHTVLSFSCLPSRPEGRAQWQQPRPPFRQKNLVTKEMKRTKERTKESKVTGQRTA